MFPIDNIKIIIHAYADDDDDGFDDDFDKIADSSVSHYNLAVCIVICSVVSVGNVTEFVQCINSIV